MREKKTVFKLFFVWDFEKEERWLNEMAQEGWVLDNTGFSFLYLCTLRTGRVYHPLGDEPQH